MKRIGNITLLLYILWVVAYNMLGKPDSWLVGYYLVESGFLASIVLMLMDGNIPIKKWLGYEVVGYLIFRCVFVALKTLFHGVFEMLDDSEWFMRGIGFILLLVIIINRKR